MEPYQTKRNLKGINYRGMSASAAARTAATRNNVRYSNRQGSRGKYMSAKEEAKWNRIIQAKENQRAAEQEARNFMKFWRESQKAPPPRAPSPPRNNKTRRNLPKNNRPNYYNALKIPKTAKTNEIRSAYRKLALETHPDKGGDEEKFKKIQAAQETLSNSLRRYEYNVAKGFKNAEPTAW